jgi:Ca2+/H+ antiporter
MALMATATRKMTQVYVPHARQKLTMMYTATVIAQSAVPMALRKTCARGFRLPLPEFFHNRLVGFLYLGFVMPL